MFCNRMLDVVFFYYLILTFYNLVSIFYSTQNNVHLQLFNQKEYPVMKKYIVGLMLLCGVQANSQNNAQPRFAPPFDFPLVLSGNFGEIRSNHFHGGLDFKTQSVSGKRVLALGDGYISRIRVTQGSGYVLDVKYDNGYTTILRHNEAFASPIAKRVEDLQYAKESWEVEIVPEPGEYPVKAGQYIARSGNLGYSFGPHLHMDMLETESGDYIDPLPFFKSRIKDTRSPKATEFMLFPQKGRGVVNYSNEPQAFSIVEGDTIKAWGVIGSAIKAYDYMDGANNRYGVHTVVLSVDGKEVFRSVVDRFSSYENRMINSWTYNQFMKSFIEPGNTLRMLSASNNNRGLVTINEERPYRFLYELKDLYGNTARYSFVVHGTRLPVPAAPPRDKYYFAWDRANYLNEPGMQLVVPRKRLYDDVYLNFEMRTDTNTVSYVYQLTKELVPLHTYADLKIGIRKFVVPDLEKYYVARINDKGKLIRVGGKYEDGFMKARIRELGTYAVALDTVAPVITAVAKNNWARNGKIIYKVKEEESGIRSYKGMIDGKYALFGLHIMNNRLICELDPARVKKGGTHKIVLRLTDNCGNITVIRDTFVW